MTTPKAATKAARPVTLAQLRAAAPKGWRVSEHRYSIWRVIAEKPSDVAESYTTIGIWHPDRQTARRACLAALKELNRASRENEQSRG